MEGGERVHGGGKEEEGGKRKEVLVGIATGGKTEWTGTIGKRTDGHCCTWWRRRPFKRSLEKKAWEFAAMSRRGLLFPMPSLVEIRHGKEQDKCAYFWVSFIPRNAGVKDEPAPLVRRPIAFRCSQRVRLSL